MMIVIRRPLVSNVKWGVPTGGPAITVEWQTQPTPSFIEGTTTPYPLGQHIANYNAATDTVTLTGLSGGLPVWLQLLGNQLAPDGTQSAGNPWTNLQFRVTRIGAVAPADTGFISGTVDAEEEEEELPAWVPAPGVVAAISLNTMSAVNPGAGVWNPNGNQQRILEAWGSGGFSPHFGPLGAYFVCNGGDQDYWGNEVYVFPLADTTTTVGFFPALTWKRINSPSAAMNGTSSTIDPAFNITWGEHGDGTPAMPHTYDQLEYLPPSAGGGVMGSALLGTKNVAYKTSHFQTAHRCDLDTGVWSRASTNASTMAGDIDSPSWVYYAATNRVYGFPSKVSRPFDSNFYWLDISSGLPGTFASSGVPSRLMPAYACGRVWTEQNRIVLLGNNYTTVPTIMYFTIYNPASPSTEVIPTLVGDAMPAAQAGSFDWVPELGAFFVRSCQAADVQKLWKVTPNPSNPLAGTWTVELITMTGVAVTGFTISGMWKRFSYAGAAGIPCFLWVNSVTGAVYAYRPLGT